VLADELRQEADRLDVLDTGEAASSIRQVFSWSGRQLSDPAARMFRLLGLHPGPDISVPAAASLGGLSPGRARRALTELTGAHLLAEPSPGRYALHDLLRVYATEQAHATETDTERHAALGRILDHYLHTAHTAVLLLSPLREPVIPTSPWPGATPEQLADDQQALAWFDAEHQVLMAAVTLAAQTGFDTCAWQLPWAMTTFLSWRGHWPELAALQRTALAAVTRLGDKTGQAAVRRILAHSCARLADYDQARIHLAECLDLHGQLADRVGEARVHQSLSWVFDNQGRSRDALGHAEQALGLFRAVDHRAGQAAALNTVGWHHALLGDHQQARMCCREALALHRELGARHGEATTLDSLGYAEHHLDHLIEAAACYEHALSIFQELGDHYLEAVTLIHLGETRQAAGDRQQARDAWREALAILEDLDHPDAGQVRARLSG
jgi:tetratricopeptide (TPR) repeat protein